MEMTERTKTAATTTVRLSQHFYWTSIPDRSGFYPAQTGRSRDGKKFQSYNISTVDTPVWMLGDAAFDMLEWNGDRIEKGRRAYGTVQPAKH